MSLRPTGLGAQMTYLPVDTDPRAQVGGRAQATTWPVRPGQGLRVYFDGKSGAYDPGYYFGTVDTATTPSKTGIQKLDVDFDSTSMFRRPLCPALTLQICVVGRSPVSASANVGACSSKWPRRLAKLDTGTPHSARGGYE